MQEVLKKIDELYTLMAEKTSVLDQEIGKLKDRKAKQEEVERVQAATAAHLAARERIIKKYEDFDKRVKEVDKKEQDLNKEKLILKERIEANVKRQKELDKAVAEAEAAKALFVKKRDAVEKEKEEIENERKLRAKIMDEIKRNF